MERMGPEALMVLGRTAVPSEMAEYLRLEYGSEDPRVVAAVVATREDEPGPAEPREAGWGARARAWLGRGRRAPEPVQEPVAVWAVPALLRTPPGRAP